MAGERAAIVGLSIASLLAFGQELPFIRVVVTDGEGAQTVAERAARASTQDTAIDRNEAAVRGICLSYVEAQSAFRADHSNSFAGKIRSTPGRRDALYWPLDESGDESPMGPGFAAAAVAEQPTGEARPWFGYYFKVVPERQGVALVAWPADYGITGLRTFVADHHGDIYSRDLGRRTRRTAMEMTAFTPDAGWKKVASAETR